MPDFSRGIIYKVHNPTLDRFYVGSTVQTLCDRLSTHRRMAKGTLTDFCKAVKELGAENFRIELVEEYPCGNMIQLERRKFEIIGQYRPSQLYNSKFGSPMEERSQNLDPRYQKAKIYIVRNSVNDILYIGSTTQSLAISMSNLCKHSKGYDAPLYEDMRKYGPDNFIIEMIEYYPCNSLEELEIREFEIIANYSADQLYNVQLEYRKQSAEKLALLAPFRHKGVAHYNFSRGSMTDNGRSWKFEYCDENSACHSKSFGYGPRSNLTSEEAHFLCLEYQDSIYPPDQFPTENSAEKIPISEERKAKLREIMSGGKHLKSSRGCIYQSKKQSKWFYEYRTTEGKFKTKTYAYNGVRAKRTSEEARLLCVAEQNRIYPLESEPEDIVA